VRMPHVASTLKPVQALRPDGTVRMHSAAPPKVIYVPPSPSDGQVRVLMRATSINASPVKMLAANYRFPPLAPTAPGYCSCL